MQFFLAYKFLSSKDNSGYLSILSKISVLGIILGIAILITVMSVMNGFEKEIKNRILSFTSHITIYGDSITSDKNLLFLDNLIKSNKIKSYSYYTENESLISNGDNSTGAMLRAVNPSLESKVSIISESIILGKYCADNDEGVLLGVGTAQKLGVSIGDVIDLYTRLNVNNKLVNYNKSLKVIGIYDVGLHEYNNAYIYTNINTFLASKNNNNNSLIINLARIKLENPLDASDFSSFFNSQNTTMYSRDWTKSHQSLFLAINSEKRVMFIILILVIIIAAFNIVSSLLILIKNKERDIAILMSLGASKSHVINIFLIQGMVFGLIGIVLGVALGLILSSNINNVVNFLEYLFNRQLMPPEIYHLNQIPSVINIKDIQNIVFTSIVLVFLMSIFPANKAASLKPSEIFKDNT